MSHPSLPRSTEEVAEWLGHPSVDELIGLRVWRGGAAFVHAMEQAALVEPQERGARFFDVFEADKRARKSAGTWPRADYRDWHDTDGSVRAHSAGRPRSGRVESGAPAAPELPAAAASPGSRAASTITPSDARAEAAEAILDYHFRDHALLNRALTHASVGPDNNGPLACLGDRIYNLWAARRVYALAPGAKKGVLTNAIVRLSRGETQAAIFFALELDTLLQVAESVSGNGGRITPWMASTALEALVAAIDLDGGEAAAVAFLDRVVPLSVKPRE